MRLSPALLIILLLIGGCNLPWAYSAPTNQVLNPGWETTETTDWTDGEFGGDKRTNAQAKTGSWSATLYSDNVHQDFSPAIAVADVSSFTFWYAGFTGGSSTYVLDIHYSDTTEDNYYVSFSADSVWRQLDVTADLDAGKSIETIKFGGGSGNPVWYDDVVLLSEPNVDPTITSSVVSSMDDTNNVYGMKYYDFTTIINDGNGASDIKAISVRVAQDALIRWMVNATGLDGTPSFDIITGADVIDLRVASCLFSELDDVGTLYLNIRYEWDCLADDDLEIEVWATDTSDATVGWSTVQTNYFDVVTRVLTLGPYASAPNIPAGSDLTISGTLAYAISETSNSTSDTYPPDGSITGIGVWDQFGKEWGTDTTIVDGAYSVTFNTTGANPTSIFKIFVDGSDDYSDDYTLDKRTVTVTIQNFYALNLLQIIADLLGIPNFITPLTDALTALGIYFATALGNAVSLLVQMMRLIGLIASSVIYWMTLVVTTIISVVTTIGSILNGTLFASAIGLPIADIWAYIGFGTWAPLLVLILLIMWWDGLTPRSRRSGVSVYQVMIGDFQVSMYLVELVYSWGMNLFNFVYGVVTWVAGLLATGLNL